MIAGLKSYPVMKDCGVEWLGEVPEHWEVERLKFSIRNVIQQTGERRNGDLYVALEHVESWTGRRRPAGPDVMFDGQVKRFEPGDVLFGKLRPYLAKVTRPTSGGVCVGEFLVLRPQDAKVSPPYIEQVLRSKPVIDAVNSSTFGAKMPRANWQFLGGMVIPLPPLPEQAAIVCFLDHVERRIRRYIRAKQKLIKLLKEQKQAIIHRAVTRGLDPNVRTKHSGVEWLGEVPKHWEVVRAKRAFRARTELAQPGDVQLSATQAYGVIAQEEFERRIGRKVTRIEKNLDKRRHVEVDDFVISMRSFQGGLERAWEGGCIRSSYVVLKPATPVCVPFFASLFKSRGYIGALQATANFIRDGQDLNYDNFCAVDLPWPPIEEQVQIVEELAAILHQSARAADKAQREISLLQELRTRLIADVVTGKLDVREAGARLPEEVEDPEPLDEPDDLPDPDALTDELEESLEEVEA